MAFAAHPQEFARQFQEPRLSKVSSSPLYDRRTARPAIDDKPFLPPLTTSGEEDLTEKMGGMEITPAVANSAINMPATRQVKELVNVIEKAEFAIRNQMEENENLRTALRVTEWELQNSKMEQHGVPRAIDDHPHDPYQARQGSQRPGGPGADRHGHMHSNLWAPNGREGYSVAGLPEEQQGSIIIHPTAAQPMDYQNGGSRTQVSPGKRGHQPSGNGANGGHKNHHRGGHPHLPPIVDTNSSGVSSPSSRSMSPTQARRRDAEMDTRSQTGAQTLPQLPSDVNGDQNAYSPPESNANHNQQEMALRTTRSQQEEISVLHKRLTEASIKEAQVQSEKRILERRVAELRLAYDQQQQGLVDAASKALSYRQDVLEENIRLTYSLQAADTERSVYISSLLPLLAEFDLQPTVTDAHSMVSAIKILVQHLRSELNLSEMQGKNNKDLLFGQSWRPDHPYHSPGRYTQQPQGKLHGLEIVPQQAYTHPQLPSSPPSPMHQAAAWESVTSPQFPGTGNEHAQFGGPEPVVQPRSSPRGNHFQPTQFSTHEDHDNQNYVRPPDMSDTDEHLSNGAPLGPEEAADPATRSPRSPHLPTLPEETTSEDGDPLPAIQGLQIVGHAVLGGRLTACGHSINGTALCMFQWVRHAQNNTSIYIEGAAQPEYTITADDANTMIAIECVPMDDRNRRGELVTVYANENRWITCDPMMQDQIDSYHSANHASFEVQCMEVDGGPDENNWDPVTLTVRRNMYELRRISSSRRVVVSEKYSNDVMIKIPVGHLVQCVITSSVGRSFWLEFRDSRNRDVGVLIFRRFQKEALDAKRGGRRSRGFPFLFS